MATGEVRPSFSLETDLDGRQVMVRLRQLVSDLPTFQGQFTPTHAMIFFRPEKRHFWSPWMHLEISTRKTEDRETAEQVKTATHQISGWFSPNPSIWTGFMLAWLSAGVLTFFTIIFGLSQQLSKMTPWAYLLIPVWLGFAAALWIASQAGQNLAREQIDELIQTVHRYLADRDVDEDDCEKAASNVTES